MCVDEISGKRKLDYAKVCMRASLDCWTLPSQTADPTCFHVSLSKKVPEDIEPLRILPVGHYAVSIAWSDGHTSSIYPFRDLEQIVQIERLG